MASGFSLEDLLGTLRALLTSPDPVTFYDAYKFVHLALKRDPHPLLLQNTVVLHDATHTTQGAREILANFVRASLTKQDAQRQLSLRQITYRDNKKTARAPMGTTLRIVLKTRRHEGYRWQMTSLVGPGLLSQGQVERSNHRNTHFHLQINPQAKPGDSVYLCLEESRPDGQQPNMFELIVLVEMSDD